MKLCTRLETARGFTESGVLRGKSQQDLEKQLQLFGGATFPSNLLATEREKFGFTISSRPERLACACRRGVNISVVAVLNWQIFQQDHEQYSNKAVNYNVRYLAL